MRGPAATTPGRAVGQDFLVASCIDGTATRNSSTPIINVDPRPAAYGRT
ncbi:hypothetical protein ACIA8E_32775 [Streptomyces sp. NPDC051664]